MFNQFLYFDYSHTEVGRLVTMPTSGYYLQAMHMAIHNAKRLLVELPPQSPRTHDVIMRLRTRRRFILTYEQTKRHTERSVSPLRVLFCSDGNFTYTSFPALAPFHTCLGRVCYPPSMMPHRWFDNRTAHADHQQHFQAHDAVLSVLRH